VEAVVPVPVAGRKPKPEGQAVNRHKPTHDWIEVVDVPFQGGPKLPKDGRTWPTWTKRWWGVVSTMPHCVLWTDSDWEFALDTAVLKAKFHTEPAAGLATEIRNRERVLGTTADYRRDLRIRYVEKPAEQVPAEVTSLDDYRNL
jgi:hypothetical protein